MKRLTSSILPAIILAMPLCGSSNVNVSETEHEQEVFHATVPTENGTAGQSRTVAPEAVDLGLSVKWATFNVGAASPEDYGDYYAWGETETKPDYSWITYHDSIDGNRSDFRKYYNGDCGKTVLDPDDDVAHVKWGGSWRMPTDDECTELRGDCTWTWTTLGGVDGFKVTSKKKGYTDKWIFLPAAGCLNGTRQESAGLFGYYWSSSLYSLYSFLAMSLDIYSRGYCRYGDCRYYGRSVRPVCE